MNSIFKKVVASVLTAALTITSLTGVAFAGSGKDTFTITGNNSLDLEYKGSTRATTKSYDWEVIEGDASLVDLDEDLMGGGVTVSPAEKDNYTTTVTLRCTRASFEVKTDWEKVGLIKLPKIYTVNYTDTYECVVNIDMLGVYFVDANGLTNETRDVTVYVDDEDGNPVAGASVEIFVKSTGVIGLGAYTDSYTVKTNSNGKATLIINDSTYERVIKCVVSKAGYNTTTTNVDEKIGLFHNSDKVIKTTLPVQTFEVKFLDSDGTTVLGSETYPSGTSAETVKAYAATIQPASKVSAEFTCDFAGWDADITDVTGKAVYTATFTSGTKNAYSYTIGYDVVDFNGNAIEGFAGVPTVDTTGLKLDYGTAITAPAVPEGFELYEDAAEVTITENEDANVLTIKIVPVYTVSFTENGVESSNDYRYGAALVVPTASDYYTYAAKKDFKEYHFTFKTWNDGTNDVTFTGDETVTADAAYTAVYNKIPVIKFYIQNPLTNKWTLVGEVDGAFILDENGNFAGTNFNLGNLKGGTNNKNFIQDTVNGVNQFLDSSKIPAISSDIINNNNLPENYELVWSAIKYENDGFHVDGTIKTYTVTTNYTIDGEALDDLSTTKLFIKGGDYKTSGLSDYENTELYDVKIATVIDEATGNVTVTYNYETIFTVVYQNDLGAELYRANFTYDDSMPEYEGSVPEKESDAANTYYTFAGWSEGVESESEANTIIRTANFDSKTVLYASNITETTAPEETVEIDDDPSAEGQAPETTTAAEETIEIGDEGSATAENPNTGVGLGGVVAVCAVSLAICAACVLGGKKKLN